MKTNSIWLTVKKLKELIKDLPDDMRVKTEGCDCVGPASGVQIYKDWWSNGETFLIINRNDRLEK